MRHPLHFCPECLEKLWWATGADPARRFEALEGFFGKNGLVEEAAYHAAAREAIEGI
jgi:hypothetical protein